LGTAAGVEAEVLGHGHGFVEVACEPVGGVRVAGDRDRLAAFFAPPLRDPWSIENWSGSLQAVSI